MSVTTYDSSFSFKQDQVARLGDRAKDRVQMTAQDRVKFEQSPFMQKMKEIDDTCWRKFSDRDKKRAQKDPNFRPRDEDFEAPKAHKYDKGINYYKVLGLDEYASQDEVKKSYRKLSLTYHPDKLSGKTQEEKDECAQIFMEIKNAYKTLSDEPTRRQYDFDRERDFVSHEAHGKKPNDKASFDAVQALLKMAEKAKENKKLPSETVKVPVQCRLEKFVYGGHKSVKRIRQKKDKEMDEYVDEERVFRIDVPPLCEMPFHQDFRRQGDQHDEREPDTLRFFFTAKSHPAVDRVGNDLRVRQTIEFGDRLRLEPYISCQAPSVNGRHYLLWGCNPFFRSPVSADTGELQLRLLEEGAGKGGALVLNCRVGLRDDLPPSSEAAEAVRASTSQGARGFIERFRLGPRWGELEAASATEVPRHGHGGAADSLAMQPRLRRRQGQKPRCELELKKVGEPIPLYTKPHSSITFLMTTDQSSCPIFAICLSSPPCGKKKGAADWDRLKVRLLPIIQRTGFHMLQQARAILPRPIARRPAFPNCAVLRREDEPAMPWKHMGDEAFKKKDYWQALWHYGKRLEELHVKVKISTDDEDEEAEEPAADEENAPARPKGIDQVPEAAKVLSNCAACFAKVRDFTTSLAYARKASELAPRWSKPWSRVGLAAWQLDDNARREAVEACAKAVELEPSKDNVGSLLSYATQLEGHGVDEAHAHKEKGNEATRTRELGLAVAMYTLAIARLPPVPQAPEDEEGGSKEAPPDEHGLLRAILHANRSAAFSRLRNWDLAVVDGRDAVSANPGIAYARCQLGAALLGQGFHQEAYTEFARAVQMEEDHRGAQKGRSACLKELVLWKSATAGARFNARFWTDLKRPKGTTRIFALSDIHFDHKENEDWVHSIDDHAFLDDVLIIAGNMADTKGAIVRGLTAFKSKFRRVFYTVGNHEMFIHHNEHTKYPDSFAKLHSIFSACDELGVDIFPAPIWEGMYVMPLLSWYTAEFDEADPFPDPNQHPDRACKWPIDADMQVWKYMMKLNEPFLKMPLFGEKITFSHFLPRRELPFAAGKKSAVKTVGCEMIDEQVRAVGSKMHIYGHSKMKYAQVHQSVRYVNMPLGLETDWPRDHKRRLMLLHDGRNFQMLDWGTDDEPPLGYVKRVQHMAFYVMPGVKEADTRKLRAAVEKFKTFEGIKACFDHMGSREKSKAEFVKEIWPDLAPLSCDATHGLMIVAEDLEKLKRVLHCDAYKKDFMPVIKSASQNECTFTVPLGLDLTFEKKPDPTILVTPIRLTGDVTLDSDKYAAICKAGDAINKLPGIEGKISVALYPLGFGKFTHREVLQKVDVFDDKSVGATHVFTVWVDSPSSFKMLVGSKTWAKWKAAYEAHLGKPKGGPQQMAFCMPLEFSATAAAPKKEKQPAAKAKAGAGRGAVRR